MSGFEKDFREWLETDGLGGFASGTVSGIRTRRYHALLLSSQNPPTDRIVLVNGLEAWVELDGQRMELSSQYYGPDVVHPRGDLRIESFSCDPWPTWTYRLTNEIRIRQELFCPQGRAAVAMRWSLVNSAREQSPSYVRLFVRPLVSGRDYHSLQHENDSFNLQTEMFDDRTVWSPYPGVPQIHSWNNGRFQPDPVWYRNFLYLEEQARGLDSTEDLASPGWFEWELNKVPAVWIATTAGVPGSLAGMDMDAGDLFELLERQQRLHVGRFASPMERDADRYIVSRYASGKTESGKTIIAGYPWFTDWGRDTFIALRGLCLATRRLDLSGEILTAWSKTVSEGMLPNRFPDHGEEPEFNSVDASLWFVVAAYEYLLQIRESPGQAKPENLRSIVRAIFEIIAGYFAGTRYGIRADYDGLLYAGQLGAQLTWMDAKVGDWVVTPRMGKPVEIQALWLNALSIGRELETNLINELGLSGSENSELFHQPGLAVLLALGREAFAQRFWNVSGQCLYDVVDSDFQPGNNDATIRPNQILAVGGLPFQLLNGVRAQCVVSVVQSKLLTPLGLRSLEPGHSDFKPHYRGGVWERDGAYHQGTVWPWLIGPFVEAWLHVHGPTAANRKLAHKQFVQPLLDHLQITGMGHVSEIADAESPYAPGGCPFQAWSLGELLRLVHGSLGCKKLNRGSSSRRNAKMRVANSS
ncbi:MAG: amylo-alpha-1,6-glucosidase [Pirellulaceae bacterium]